MPQIINYHPMSVKRPLPMPQAVQNVQNSKRPVLTSVKKLLKFHVLSMVRQSTPNPPSPKSSHPITSIPLPMSTWLPRVCLNRQFTLGLKHNVIGQNYHNTHVPWSSVVPQTSSQPSTVQRWMQLLCSVVQRPHGKQKSIPHKNRLTFYVSMVTLPKSYPNSNPPSTPPVSGTVSNIVHWKGLSRQLHHLTLLRLVLTWTLHQH